MAKQSIGLGSTANDGTGDNLRVGGDKVNDNFDEIYTALGDGSALQIITTGATSNQVLQWSTSNNRFEPTASAAAGDISVDTTPQLGGDLDINSNDITGTGSVNITGTVTAQSALNAQTGTTYILNWHRGRFSEKGHTTNPLQLQRTEYSHVKYRLTRHLYIINAVADAN